MSLRDSLLARFKHVKQYVHPVEVLLVIILTGRSLLVVIGMFNPYLYGILYERLATGEDVVASIFGLVSAGLYIAFWFRVTQGRMWYRLRVYGSRLMFSVYASLFYFIAAATGTSPASWSFLVETLACIYVVWKVTHQQPSASAAASAQSALAKAVST